MERNSKILTSFRIKAKIFTMAYTSAASWPSLPSKLISPPSLLQALTLQNLISILVLRCHLRSLSQTDHGRNHVSLGWQGTLPQQVSPC